ncbi:MAG TPA: hypothetical protein VMU06_14555 [Stellaceae bacterium]|nr:hypothetical protein [Stellaceae bacterium]
MIDSIGTSLYPTLSGSSLSGSAGSCWGLTSGDGASLGLGDASAASAPAATSQVTGLSSDVASAFQQFASDLKALLLQIQAEGSTDTPTTGGTGIAAASDAQTPPEAPDASAGTEPAHAEGRHGHHGHHGAERLERDVEQMISDLLSNTTTATSPGTADTGTDALTGGTASASAGDATALASVSNGTASASTDGAGTGTPSGSALTSLAEVAAQDLLHALRAYAESIGSAATPSPGSPSSTA